jgi:hypothetical protein
MSSPTAPQEIPGLEHEGINAFPDELERQFLEEWRARAARWLRWMCLVGAVVFTVVAPVDFLFHTREQATRFWILRFTVAVPYLLVSFYGTFRWQRFIEPLGAGAFLVSAAVLIAMGTWVGPPTNLFVLMTLCSISLAMHALPVLRFRLATATGVGLFVLFEALALYRGLALFTHIGVATNILVAQLLGMVVSYSLETAARAQFRDQRLIVEHKRRLEALVGNMLQSMAKPPQSGRTE